MRIGGKKRISGLKSINVFPRMLILHFYATHDQFNRSSIVIYELKDCVVTSLIIRIVNN